MPPKTPNDIDDIRIGSIFGPTPPMKPDKPLCPHCQHPLGKAGKTSAGVQRYFCSGPDHPEGISSRMTLEPKKAGRPQSENPAASTLRVRKHRNQKKT